MNVYLEPEDSPNVLEEAYVSWLFMMSDGDISPEEVQGCLDAIAKDNIFPVEFLEYYYDESLTQHEPFIEEEDIDHEFHFQEAPVSEDEQFNKEV